MREYLLVLCVAAGVTYLLTPVARRFAVLFGAMAQPRDRDVHAIPYDPQPASIASGVRVGTPSVTTQGMTEGDMKEVGSLIGRAVRDADGADAEDVRRAVTALVEAHPAYGRAEPARAVSASTASDNPSPS